MIFNNDLSYLQYIIFIIFFLAISNTIAQESYSISGAASNGDKQDEPTFFQKCCAKGEVNIKFYWVEKINELIQ